MFYHDGGCSSTRSRAQPHFRRLQQGIGGVQGEVCLQPLPGVGVARASACAGDADEEIAHIEMLATAVAMNLEGAPLEQEEAAKDPILYAALGGMNIQHAAPHGGDAGGQQRRGSTPGATGRAADMLTAAPADAPIWRTDDPGMKDARVGRDTMHQNHGLRGARRDGERADPLFPQAMRTTFNYTFMAFGAIEPPHGRWTRGPDQGHLPHDQDRCRLGYASPNSAVQKEQVK